MGAGPGRALRSYGWTRSQHTAWHSSAGRHFHHARPQERQDQKVRVDARGARRQVRAGRLRRRSGEASGVVSQPEGSSGGADGAGRCRPLRCHRSGGAGWGAGNRWATCRRGIPDVREVPGADRAADTRAAGREARPSRIGSMIALQPFGRTGHESTRLLFGAAAIGNVSQDDADQTMELIRAHGINHIDTAPSYGDAELRLGPWMDTHRDEFFLATKTGERTRAEAYAEIGRSLERLRTDRLDLIQLHNLVDEDEWQTAFSSGGVLEAVVQAREEGLVRFVGVTGHGV